MKTTADIVSLNTLVGFLVLTGCTNAGLQEVIGEGPEYVDNLLDIHGEYCTSPAEDMEFPVKVLIVMDQSESLQCTDEAMLRRSAVQQLTEEIRGNPSISMGYLGFHAGIYRQDFTTPDAFETAMSEYITQLGPATDYQGVLSGVLEMLESDIVNSPISLRARTKYVVIFVSDGIPEPQCNAGCEDDNENCSDGEDNDGDGLIDDGDPSCSRTDGIHLDAPDRRYGVCNTDQEIPDDEYIDMRSACPEYNQAPQILRKVEDILALSDSYGAGDLVFHTVFLFAPQEIVDERCLGQSVQYGYVREIAQPLLQSMADAGRGIFREVNVALETEGNFLQVDYQPLESSFDLTETIGININSLPDNTGRLIDTDADGIADDDEFEASTDRFGNDTDNDGYSDLFEERYRDAGFDPINGNRPHFCCPAFQLEDTCCTGPDVCLCYDDGEHPEYGQPLSETEQMDRDGDGLNTAEERFIRTDERDPDSDGDRLPDGLEFRLGTDPTEADALNDHDFDGLRTRDEIRAASDPQVPNAEVESEAGVTYDIEDIGEETMSERHCYEFEINGVELVTTLQRDGVDGQGLDPVSLGLNRIYLMMIEEPVELAGHRGNLFLGCVEATYLGNQYKSPPDGIIDLTEIREACYRSCLGCNEFETVDECRTNCLGRRDATECERCDPPCNLFYESELFYPDVHCVSIMCTDPALWLWRDVEINGAVTNEFICDDACVSDGFCNCNCLYDCDCNPYRTERCSTTLVCGS